jgi:hypothetical protein
MSAKLHDGLCALVLLGIVVLVLYGLPLVAALIEQAG